MIPSTIVFDLGNTLVRFDHMIAVRKITHVSHADPEKLYAAFFDSPFTRDFECGRITPEEFHARMSGSLGIRVPYGEFVGIWNDIFWEDAEACDIARVLKKRYKLFLLSNVNKLHFEHIRKRFGIIGIFDELILSYLVGSMKPERAIFDEVVRRAGNERAGLIYIDDRADLIEAATELGIDSIRFEGAGKLAEELRGRGLL